MDGDGFKFTIITIVCVNHMDFYYNFIYIELLEKSNKFQKFLIIN